MSLSPVTTTIFVILPHPTKPQALLLREGGSWVLPHWHSAEQHYWQEVGHVNRRVQALFGAQVTTLRCLGTAYDPEHNHLTRWYELENHGSQPEGHSGQWVGPDILPDVVDSAQRRFLEVWFTEAVAGRPTGRRAWARPGWFATAEAWIAGHVRRLGLQSTGALEQLRTWERGFVMRVPTTGGDLYFKTLPGMFHHEIRLVEALSASHPANMVTLLATDHARHWMLMTDMGGQPLDRVANLALWKQALQQFARLQIATAGMCAELQALGCPSRRVEDLPDQIDAFFAALPTYPGLSEAEIVQLRALTPRLKEACQALDEYKIPLAVEHGDFWAGNVQVTEESYIFFDWSDSSLSHPFFSLTLFLDLESMPHALPVSPNTALLLRDAYLDPWVTYHPLDQLRSAFELARTLGPLHLALKYHVQILPRMESRWEMENMVGFYLKMLLR